MKNVIQCKNKVKLLLELNSRQNSSVVTLVVPEVGSVEHVTAKALNRLPETGNLCLPCAFLPKHSGSVKGKQVVHLNDEEPERKGKG